jgi:hypothetical protein
MSRTNPEKIEVGDVVEFTYHEGIYRIVEITGMHITASNLITGQTVNLLRGTSSEAFKINMPDDFSNMPMFNLYGEESEKMAKEYYQLRRERDALEAAGETTLIIDQKMREHLQKLFLTEREARRAKREADYKERPDISSIPGDVDAYLTTSPYQGEDTINMHFPSGSMTNVQSISVWQAEELIKLLTQKINESRTHNEVWFQRNLKCLQKMASSVVKMTNSDAMGRDLMRRYANLHSRMQYAFEHLDPFVNGDEWERVYALMEEFDKLPEPEKVVAE